MTPIHAASYTTLVTIVATDVWTPIIAVPPIAIIPIGTMRIAIIPIGTVIAVVTIRAMVRIVPMAVVAVPAAIICTTMYTPIYTPIMSIVGLRLVYRQ